MELSVGRNRLCVCAGVYVLVSKATEKDKAKKAAKAKKKE